LPFNSDLARKKFFASKENRQEYYDKHFYPKGTKIHKVGEKETYDLSGHKKRDSGDIVVPNATSHYDHKINVSNKKDFDRIMDNLNDPHASVGTGSGRHSNRRLIITGKNQYFKPTIVNQKQFREMVSRRMVEIMRWQIIAREKGLDLSKEKTPHKFPMTDEGIQRQRQAMYVGVIPMNHNQK